MTQQYGDNAPLSYNKYLRVQDLIELQNCLSDPVHHDELLFITIHQAYELWFKQILHELDASIELLNDIVSSWRREQSIASWTSKSCF